VQQVACLLAPWSSLELLPLVVAVEDVLVIGQDFAQRQEKCLHDVIAAPPGTLLNEHCTQIARLARNVPVDEEPIREQRKRARAANRDFAARHLCHLLHASQSK